MLSTEKPPPDLPCPCEISQLKSNSSSDEGVSDNNQRQLEVDLLKSGLDDNNPRPKFSIRDYVFYTRSKDIKNNWPFSQKNLQLCLKCGVKDVLPPFQSLDSVRDPSIVKCAVENISCSDAKHSELSDCSVGQKLAVDIKNINSSGSEQDKEFPSTTTSQSCSDINSVPPIESPSLEPEAEYLTGSPKEKPEFAARASNKGESNIQNPVKKCRLIVKLNNIAEPKTNEDLGLNTSVVLETMASKVCPVCKIFSSSSNTTLNAHIDQCLSGESTIKWTSNSKVIKHRIKPRKTRLMVDIYETAKCCTLEELDRRNGTNWASNLGFQAEDLEACAGENITNSSVNIEDINEEGGVYIDSNGTKVRILSKLSDLPSNSNASYDCGPSKLVKVDKGSKFLSSKKKKYLIKKHKLLKHSLYGQGSCSPSLSHLLKCPPCGPKGFYPRPDHCPEPEVNNGQQNKFPPEGYKEDLTQAPIDYEQMNSDDLGMIKQWVGSKRTGLKKKINLEHENQHPDKIIKNLRVTSGGSSLGDTLVKRNTASKSPIPFDQNPLLPTESHKRKEDMLYSSHDGCVGHPSQRKRPGFSLLKYQDCLDKKSHFVFSKFNGKQSRKDILSVHKRHLDPPNGTENHVSSWSNKRMGIDLKNNDSSFISSKISQHHAFSSEGKEFASLRKTSLHHAISSGSKKFSSLRKKLLSVRLASVPGSKKNLGSKHLDLKNCRLHYSSGSDEEALVSRSSIYRQDNLVETLGGNAAQIEKVAGKPLTNRTRVLKIRKKRKELVNTGEGEMTLKGSETLPESDSLGVGKNICSFSGSNFPVDTSNVHEEVETRDEFVCEPTYNMADGEAFIAFSKSLDSTLPGLAGTSNVDCVSQHCSKAYEGHCPSELVLVGEKEMFCANKVDKNLVTPNSHVVAEMDADEAQRNYFVDVDPIPIPGPPGSFLPSPGRMGSEELQGNSSLTTCRVQSSEDEHEVVDMDSSDSPISAMSTVSNSIAARSDSVSVINLSMQSHVQHETRCDISKYRFDPVVEGSTPFVRAAGAEREVNIHDSRPNLMLSEVSSDFKDTQPCCCSRKDGALQSGSLNYQESQLLRRRTMTSLSVLAQEKQMVDDLNNKIQNFDLRSETLLEKQPTSEPENNIANSPMRCAPVLVSRNSEAKFPGDFESSSPTTSNPVLRLMGKNLMVVKKDENLSPQTRPTQSSMAIEHPGPRFSVDNGLSSSNNQNEPHSFHHTLSRGPSIFDNMQTSMPPQHFDFNSSNCFKIPANYGPPQLFPHPSSIMHSSKSFSGNFTSSLKSHEYTGGCNLNRNELGSKIRPDTQTAYDFEKVQSPFPQNKPADSSGSKHKEIIDIDDSPESHDVALAIKATRGKVNMEAGGSSVGILGSDSSRVNSFYSYQMRSYPVCTGSLMFQNGNVQMPPSKGMKGNLSKWNCTADGSSVWQPNSLAASLPSRTHLSSSLYFSPGFS